MKSTTLVPLAAGALLCAMAGCVPSARIDARNLTGGRLPLGPMAMLPPLLAADLEDPTLASIFIQDLTHQLRTAGVNVVGDDLGSAVTPREAATRPTSQRAEAGPLETQWLSLSDEERAILAKGNPYVTICQPVIVRYGYYPAYVPGQIVSGGYGGYDYTAYRADIGEEFPQYVSVADRRGAAAGGSGRSSGAARGGRDGSNHGGGGRHLGGLGWWGSDFGPDYYIPPHYEPVAQIVVAFHIYDAASGRLIYYIRASNWSSNYGPPDLEKGFYKPVNRAFRKAMGLEH